MDLNTITASDFKSYFRRDFPYLPSVYTDPDKYVLDEDIDKAFTEAQSVFNQSIYGEDRFILVAYYYLTAHYLCNDMKSATGGISAASSFPVSSRTVGSVSEAYTIPQAYIDNPAYAFYTNSAYGMKYLALSLPNLVGNIGVVAGWSNP